MGRITIATIADMANEYADSDGGGFWAARLIGETIDLWRIPKYYDLLSEYSQAIADSYIYDPKGYLRKEPTR